EVTFVEVEAWGRTAEVVGQYLTKGSPCYLEGRLKLDTWTDKDNQKRTRIKVVAETVQFLSRGARPGEGGAPSLEAEEPAPASSARPAPAPARTTAAGKPRVSSGSVAAGVLDEPPF
ncbi:MAG TPA: single-stranded DNA-binding protein, partial [Cystobacter sp.]